MRENKFRGKSIETGEWVYGSFVNNLFWKTLDDSPVCYIVTDNEESADWEEVENLFIEVHPDSVGQLIITNKNGTEIYVGDIDGSDEPMYTTFENGCYGLKFKDNHNYFDSCVDWNQLKIIGNVFEKRW